LIAEIDLVIGDPAEGIERERRIAHAGRQQPEAAWKE
jgi:hypothetical protein